MEKRAFTLKLTMENGEEVEMDVEMKADNPQEMGPCLSGKLFDDIDPYIKTPMFERTDNLDIYADVNYKQSWVLCVCIASKPGRISAYKLNANQHSIRVNADFPFDGLGYVLAYFHPDDLIEGEWINRSRFFGNCVEFLDDLKNPDFEHKDEIHIFEIETPAIPPPLQRKFKQEETWCFGRVENYLSERACQFTELSPFHGKTCEELINSREFLRYHNQTCCNMYLERYQKMRPRLKEGLICK